MALAHSPKIVTDGLIFYYDMGNPQKSWKGAPTTNLTPNMSLQAVQGAPTVSFVGVEDGWNKYSLNGTWTAGTYPYSMAVQVVTFTGGVTYSTGVYIKTNVPQKFASLFTGMNYVNEPMNNAGTSFSITQPDGSIYVGRSGFQYTNTTAQVGYLLSQPIIGQTFNGATDFVFIRYGQIEIGAFPTPFVAGTRSSTQAILDLTNNNTITATSLTYNSDGTFSFNGSSNWIESPTSSIFDSQTITMESWNKPTTTSQSGFLFEKGQVNTQYSNFYNSDGVFYFRTMALSPQDLTFTAATHIVGGQWNHIVCTVGSGVKTVYINGIQRYQQTGVTGTMPTGQTNQYVGKYGNAGNNYPFNGQIAISKVYNRVLTAQEVQQNFNALRSRYAI